MAQALVKITDPGDRSQLIDLLETCRARFRADIVQHLHGHFGRELRPGRRGLEDWWKDHEETFEFPAGFGQRSENSPGHGSMYYGLSIYAQKLVFIIDTSGSMLEPAANFQALGWRRPSVSCCAPSTGWPRTRSSASWRSTAWSIPGKSSWCRPMPK